MVTNATIKPTEVETKWFQDFEPKLPSLEGKTVAITGCTTGIGLIVAKTAVKKNARHVLLLNRKSSRADAAEQEIKRLLSAGSSTVVETIPCDLQDFASVKEAAALIKSKYDALDVLCNNAGVMALDDYATKDGYDVQMQTNHLSHFLLTKELYPLLKRARDLRGEARVANHTSEARRFPSTHLSGEYYEKKGGNLGGNATGQNDGGPGMFFNGPRWERYHQSKLANTVFTLALKDRFGSSGIKAVCAAPGLSATNLQVTTQQSGGMEENQANMLVGTYQSAEDGSMPYLMACFDPSTENGDLFEPAEGWSGPAVKVEYDEFSAYPTSTKVLWELSEVACGKFAM